MSETDEKRSTPASLRLKAISAALTVDDIEASIAWYRDVVGFHLEETYERDGKVAGASLAAGDQRIVISQDDWGKGRDRKKGQGIRLYLEASQDVDEIAAAIEARGGTLATPPTDMPWGTRAFNLTDPTGYQLTISS